MTPEETPTLSPADQQAVTNELRGLIADYGRSVASYLNPDPALALTRKQIQRDLQESGMSVETLATLNALALALVRLREEMASAQQK